MTPERIAYLIEDAGLILLGVYLTLLGYRLIGKKPGLEENADRKDQKSGGCLRLGGPLLMICGVVLFFVHRPEQPPPELDWRIVTTSDRFLQVEMPGAPVDKSSGTNSSRQEVKIVRPNGTVCIYQLIDIEIAPSPAENTPKELFDNLRDATLNGLKRDSQDMALISDTEIEQEGIPGREIEMFDGKGLVKVKAFVAKKHLYEMVAITGKGKASLAERDRFFGSIAFPRRQD